MKEPVASRLRFGLLLILLGAVPPSAYALEVPSVSTSAAEVPRLEGRKIASVSFLDNRTSGAFLMSRITLQIGNPFHQADLETTRKKLYAMRLFKKIDITPKLNAQGTVDVTIRAKDGWYVVPVPFAFSGASGSGVSLNVLERNYLAQNESIIVGGAQSDQGSSGNVGAAFGRWSGNAELSKTTFEQYRFADGGLNVSDMLGAKTLSDPGRFGEVASMYDKEIREGSAAAQYAIFSWARLGLGFTASRIGYSTLSGSGAMPVDNGRQNFAEASLDLGTASHTGVSGLADSVGAVFGLGMADLDQRLVTLDSPLLTWGSAFTADVGNGALGSDYDFTRYRAEGDLGVEFPERHAVELKAVAAKGFDMPFTQDIATDRTLGLQGSYIREFVGDAGAGVSLSGIYYFRRSRRGVLAVQVFAETASVWGDGGGGRQSGVGGSVYYSFWRCPLPIGLGYTYSIPDHDGEISLAVGAHFGN